MEKFPESSCSSGQGWYPKDYYTHDTMDYLIHAFNNFKADNIKAVYLYDAYLNVESTSRKEAEMIELEKEQIINQKQMIRKLKNMQIF